MESAASPSAGPCIQPCPDIPLTQLIAVLTAVGRDYARLTAPGKGPALLPDDAAHQVLADRLKIEGIVSSYQPGSSGKMKVHMKRH